MLCAETTPNWALPKTEFGGANGDGTVFELVNHGGGNYTPTTLLSFNYTNGATPVPGLIADAAGTSSTIAARAW